MSDIKRLPVLAIVRDDHFKADCLLYCVGSTDGTWCVDKDVTLSFTLVNSDEGMFSSGFQHRLI